MSVEVVERKRYLSQNPTRKNSHTVRSGELAGYAQMMINPFTRQTFIWYSGLRHAMCWCPVMLENCRLHQLLSNKAVLVYFHFRQTFCTMSLWCIQWRPGCVFLISAMSVEVVERKRFLSQNPTKKNSHTVRSGVLAGYAQMMINPFTRQTFIWYTGLRHAKCWCPVMLENFRIHQLLSNKAAFSSTMAVRNFSPLFQT